MAVVLENHANISSDWSLHTDLLLDGGEGPSWRKHPAGFAFDDDILAELEQEDTLNAHARKELLYRTLHVRHPEVIKLKDTGYMAKHDYSLVVCPLDVDMPFSGRGAERGYIVWIYYEASRESLLHAALQTIGVRLADGIQKPVEKHNCSDYEQEVLYSKSPLVFTDQRYHAPSEKIKLDGCSYYPWAGRMTVK
eukprot:TRINITY_DN107520_c0_g1_i1.p1 TRINITY_DN107520_c0_g1~~TRINITY_DN107520_c0_g1_i1.p1  ORF type:complete len:205 (+),score=42.79 TRINITY_DN107520_c0_g1_i1:36-617(+)